MSLKQSTVESFHNVAEVFKKEMASEEGVRAGSREILLRLDGAPRVGQKYHRYKNVGFAVALVYKRFQMMLSSLYLHQHKHGISR